MTYTSEDAAQEVGNSTDWKVGFLASLKKWEKIASGEITAEEYGGKHGSVDFRCGFCFTAANICRVEDTDTLPCSICPASSICTGSRGRSPKMIHCWLRQLGESKGWL